MSDSRSQTRPGVIMTEPSGWAGRPAYSHGQRHTSVNS